MGRTSDWLQRLGRRRALREDVARAVIWSPRDGDAAFRGEPGRDVLWLDGCSLPQLRDGLRLEGGATRLHVEGNGTACFRDGQGGPAIAAGTLRLDGATLRFSGLSCFAFIW